jgi:ubiquitin C-terminal hydrolase
LTPCYIELINKLWDKNQLGFKSVSPSNFVQKLNEMNPLFKLGEAGDSKDFIIYILEQIHRELKKTINFQ